MKNKFESILPKANQTRAQACFDDKAEYESRLFQAQKKLLTLQQKLHRTNKKIVIVLEGQDTAGKGGVIRRMAQYLDPRAFQVHATSKPTECEIGEHYFQRFFERLPKPGRIAVFDRSWYGRVLVERVEKFASKNEWQRAYAEINNVERMLVEDGIPVFKYFLDISYKEQGKRFKERENDPLKAWKMTPEDYRNRKKWKAYNVAFRDMLKKTSPAVAPWKVIAADSKWHARVAILEDIVRRGF